MWRDLHDTDRLAGESASPCPDKNSLTRQCQRSLICMICMIGHLKWGFTFGTTTANGPTMGLSGRHTQIDPASC